jgi:hypothetical protein
LSLPPNNEGPELEFFQPSKIPAEWMRGLVILETRPVPRGVPQRLWDQFLSDARLFIRSPENWAARAYKIGWTTSDSVRPFDHLASAGLLWLLRHSAIFVDATGTEHMFDRLHRRPSRSPPLCLGYSGSQFRFHRKTGLNRRGSRHRATRGGWFCPSIP